MLLKATIGSAVGSLVAVEESDLGLSPDFSAPWMNVVRDIVGWVFGTLFVLAGLLFVIGLFVFLVCKFVTSNSPGQEKGLKAILWGIVGIVAMGSASSIMVWVLGWEPFADAALATIYAPVIPSAFLG